MCGIAGLISHKVNHLENVNKIITKLSHRGPDNNGIWQSDDKTITFGHTRLSILDLSSAGNQPMISSCGRYVLTYNGEIYNHLSLRKKIEAKRKQQFQWKGSSDTETLLESFVELGVKNTLESVIGMFAFGLWDAKHKKLILGRDRLGEKPLYYGWVNDSFVFASELKAVKAIGGFQNKICQKSLSLYMQLMYMPTPYSIYSNIYKLHPGALLIANQDIDAYPLKKPPELNTNINGLDYFKWWDFNHQLQNNSSKQIIDNYQAEHKLDEVLNEAVQSQLISDVPIGSFLSGGIDSSLITAMMQKNSKSPVRTFSLGFQEYQFDESRYAKKIAAHLKTDHNELIISHKDSLQIIPKLCEIYDEPFADSSQIPTCIISKFAREKITVALSGDGGDELFGGYNRYFWTERIWNKIQFLPFALRKKVGEVIAKSPIGILKIFDKLFNSLPVKGYRIQNFPDKIYKLSNRMINVENLDQLYLSLISEWYKNKNPVLNAETEIDYILELKTTKSFNNHKEKMMILDTLTYLPDDILCKVDRASMSCGLETRVPMLDHRVVNTAWQIPLKMKITKNSGKKILKNILKKYIPQTLTERPKMGFGIPLDEWLRGPLRDWAEDLLNQKNLNSEEHLDSKIIKDIWNNFLKGNRSWGSRIWTILMFQAWKNQK